MAIDREDLAHTAYNMGRSALDEGKTAQAIELLRASVHLAPHFKTSELLGEALLSQGLEAEAMLYLAASVGLGRNQPRARFLLAEALVTRGKETEALRLLNEALALTPQYRSAAELRTRLLQAGVTLDE